MTRTQPEDATLAMGLAAESSPPDLPVGRWSRRFIAPPVLVPIVAAITLGILWLATLNLVRVEHENARRAARDASQELLETYEAQVVRALREIDQTLKALQYSYQLRGDGPAALADLAERDLLPPSLVFTVSVTNADGEVVATTGTSPLPAAVDADFFARARRVDALTEAPPVRSGGEWWLRFGRGLGDADGTFGGVAVVEVDAAFFVSGYDHAKLGERGVLALLGTDGVFRVRRTGEAVTHGASTDYAAVVAADPGPGDTEAVLALNRWDGVRRYTSARQLYDFPLAVVVGLSEEEQLAPVGGRSRIYFTRAAAVSLLVVLVMAALGRMSWDLEKLRRRAGESHRAHARRVEHLAYHDALTGLPNRSLLTRLLEDRIRQATRYGGRLAVLFLDLDGFKRINDTLGHDAGDELLREVARRLQTVLRGSDVVARMGGDEFVILLPEVLHEGRVTTVGRNVLAALQAPFVLLGERFSVTASIGISVFPQDGTDEQTLMKNADIAMYDAKEAGRNLVRFFSPEMGAASVERLHLETSLRRALKDEELELHYQARRDLDGDRITGVEALVRWEHPALGTIGPSAFLSLAEETGLVLPMGRWVLRTACAQSAAWRREGLPPLRMAVNLGAQQFFDGSLLTDVAAALAESGMEAALLELEVPESVLVHDLGRTLPILHGLKELGVAITVDNFGRGYSSLATLRHLPVDTIKTDRLFLREGDEAVSLDVATAIVEMARTLSPSVVVQGVETKEQAAHLRRIAGSQVQGFYFDHPVCAAAFAELLLAEEPVRLRAACA